MVLVRTATAADLSSIAAIYDEEVRHGISTFASVPPGPDYWEERLASTHPGDHVLVAERDGAVAGYAYGTAHRTRPAYRWVVEVTVYVDAARHRSGVGRELYQALLPLLARQRLQVVVAGITLPNDASVALHESVGFQPVGIYRDFGYKFGAWHDVGWWQARLAPATAEPQEPLAPQRLG